MKKKELDEKLLREAIRLMMKEEWRQANEEIKKNPPVFSPEFHEKRNYVYIELIMKIQNITLFIICRMMHLYIQLPLPTMKKKDINIRFNGHS